MKFLNLITSPLTVFCDSTRIVNCVEDDGISTFSNFNVPSVVVYAVPFRLLLTLITLNLVLTLFNSKSTLILTVLPSKSLVNLRISTYAPLVPLYVSIYS